jgi:hypothetical protein
MIYVQVRKYLEHLQDHFQHWFRLTNIATINPLKMISKSITTANYPNITTSKSYHSRFKEPIATTGFPKTTSRSWACQYDWVSADQWIRSREKESTFTTKSKVNACRITWLTRYASGVSSESAWTAFLSPKRGERRDLVTAEYPTGFSWAIV